MSENQMITSFVVRCSLIDVNEVTNKKEWRIRVSYVQGEEEIIVTDLDDAVDYMKRIIEE